MIDYKQPDYLPILKQRIARLNLIRSNKKLLEAAKIHYKHNPVDFINDWMVTYDPRKTPSTVPFILWPKQREYIHWLSERYALKEDGLAEKSRDAGATFLNVAFAVCLWLFEPGSKVSFGSRKEALVDKIGDTDTIFEKIRIILRGLPSEFLPRGYNELKHVTYMKAINPQTGATITGEAGDNIGRGGRSGLYFKDEAAFYERPELIDAALSQNSDVKIDVSTPNGNGNPFYRKRFSGKIKVFVFDWRDDPRKDDSWYQKQKDSLEPWILAQEVDRDYSAAVEGICIPAAFVRAAIDYKVRGAGFPVAGLDVADEAGENVLTIREGVKVTKVIPWTGSNTTQTARKAVMLCKEELVVLLNYDSIGVGAGVTGEISELKAIHTGDGSYMPIVMPVNTGNDELTGMYTDTIPDKKIFVNKRASMWWKARRRFERTYEVVNGIKTWPEIDLISIPNDPELVAQLSQPLVQFRDGGKIQIESKKDMRKRGIKSPDRADSLMLAFTNEDLVVHAADRLAASSEAQRTVDFVTGKNKTPPWIAPSSGKKYIDFQEGA